MTRHVRFLVYPGFVLLDLSGPMEALSFASQMYGGDYRLTVASMAGGPVRSSCGLEIATEPLTIEVIDTFVVVGAPAPPEGSWVGEIADAISAACTLARRTASVCTGAFLLAASGVLDGRSATTHWFFARKLGKRCTRLCGLTGTESLPEMAPYGRRPAWQQGSI